MHACEHSIDHQGLWQGWVTASNILQPSPPQLRSPWQAAKPSSTDGSLAALFSLEGRLQAHSEARCLPGTPQLRGAWHVGRGKPLEEVMQRDFSYVVLGGLSHLVWSFLLCTAPKTFRNTHIYSTNTLPELCVCVARLCAPCKRHTSPAKHQTRSTNTHKRSNNTPQPHQNTKHLNPRLLNIS